MIVRTISYGGQKHPVRNKRVVTVPVSRLPLLSVDAVRTFIHLAGPRWSSDPPKDSGFGTDEVEAHGHFGYIKISCEDFPRAGMNLKWASDVLDQLVLQSNVSVLVVLNGLTVSSWKFRSLLQNSAIFLLTSAT